MKTRRIHRPILLAVAVASLTAIGPAQSSIQTGRVYTAADYAAAEKFMEYNVSPLVYHTIERPTWLADGRFWYRDPGPQGSTTFILVDPMKKTKGPAFDHAKVAAELTALVASGGLTLNGRTTAARLPIEDLILENGDTSVLLTVGRQQKVRCGLADGNICKTVSDTEPKLPKEPSSLSPDKKKAVFIRQDNLWVRDLATGQDTQLTQDGIPDYGYATDNAGWAHSDNPIVLWSPDSKKVATFQLDQRKVGNMYLVRTDAGHPTLESWKYPLAGDPVVQTVDRVVIDVDAHKVVRFKMAPDMHRSTLCDNINCGRGDRGWDDVQWSEDGNHLAFVSTSRDHQQEWLRLADTNTGEIREVMNEKVATDFESGNGKTNWKYLPKSNEVLWFSEKDNWGQLYLFDLTTGKLKNQITRGDGNVTRVLHIDEPSRTIYFLAVGKEKGRDPYYSALYKVNFDGSGMKLLTPADADHAVTPSADGHYFIDTASTVSKPQTTVVLDSGGQIAVELASQDITKLKEMGWVPPTPITVKSADGKDDLYGYLYKPTTLDPAKKYPIVNHIYPGPQTGSCGSRAFAAAHADMQSLAELGFVVVCIDGTGTPFRSKSFHDAHYGDFYDNTIPDQIAGMKQLAAKYPWIDIDRAGIYGHSGGGAATGAAMFHAPEFFKVGISESGNHDNRVYEDDWGEKWVGLLKTNPDGTTNYDSQANQNSAKNLKGHLLLVHGTLDNNVPPYNTLLVVDALMKANKDFDLIMVPNARHAYGAAAQYVARRRWDYFVHYLAGGTPPEQYQMKPYAGPRGGAPATGSEDDGIEQE